MIDDHARFANQPSIHPSSYRRDHDQPEQEADDTDEEQQQLPAVPPPQLLGVQVGHRRHQGLQAHELGDKKGGVVLPGRFKVINQSLWACVCVSTCVSSPSMMIMMKKHTAQS